MLKSRQRFKIKAHNTITEKFNKCYSNIIKPSNKSIQKH